MCFLSDKWPSSTSWISFLFPGQGSQYISASRLFNQNWTSSAASRFVRATNQFSLMSVQSSYSMFLGLIPGEDTILLGFPEQQFEKIYRCRGVMGFQQQPALGLCSFYVCRVACYKDCEQSSDIRWNSTLTNYDFQNIWQFLQQPHLRLFLF